MLSKQLKVLKVQKKIYDKLSIALSILEEKVKKVKDTLKKKEFEEEKARYKECCEVLKYIRIDETMLEEFFIKPLSLIEYSLILLDMLPEECLPVSNV